MPAARLLRDALQRGPLPDEQPAAALWWRVAEHVGNPNLAGTPTTSAIPVTSDWAEQLHLALGDPAARRITADRLWPVVVDRVDTAVRDGADADALTRDAASLLRPHLDTLNPHEFAPAFMARLAALADPPPADLDKESAPGTDERPIDADALLHPGLTLLPTTAAEADDRDDVVPAEPPADLDELDPDALPPGDDLRAFIWTVHDLTVTTAPYADLAPAERVAALRGDMHRLDEQIAEVDERLRTGTGPQLAAHWTARGRDLASRADELRPYVVASEEAHAEWTAAEQAADTAAHTAASTPEPDDDDVDQVLAAIGAQRDAAFTRSTATAACTRYDEAQTALHDRAGDQPVVTHTDVDLERFTAAGLDLDQLQALRVERSQTSDELFRAGSRDRRVMKQMVSMGSVLGQTKPPRSQSVRPRDPDPAAELAARARRAALPNRSTITLPPASPTHRPAPPRR